MLRQTCAAGGNHLRGDIGGKYLGSGELARQKFGQMAGAAAGFEDARTRWQLTGENPASELLRSMALCRRVGVITGGGSCETLRHAPAEVAAAHAASLAIQSAHRVGAVTGSRWPGAGTKLRWSGGKAAKAAALIAAGTIGSSVPARA